MADVLCSDLGQLQQDLENFSIILKKQYSNLQKRNLASAPSADKKDETSTASAVAERKLSSDEKPLKKIKFNNEKVSKLSSARAKNKRSIKTDFATSEKSSEIPKTLKNDSINRFWSYIDSYCADITLDDIKMLEKWIESHENDSDYQAIPPLGDHYSIKWMEDDLMEELKEGSKAVENPKGISCRSMDDESVKDLLQKAQDENEIPSNSGPPPLVQNLISSLVRENFITSPNEVMAEPMLEPCLSVKPLNESKSNSRSVVTLEDHLREQLTEVAILESSSKDPEDELLLELKRLQALLVPVSKYNLLKKEKLLSRAKAEMSKQESQKRIQEADAKVMESYRSMSAARKKEGKKITKKEVLQIRTVLEEREKILKSSKTVNSFEMCSNN